MCALKTRTDPWSTRERSLLQLLVSAIQALAFIAGCIAKVSLRLNSIRGSFILNLLDKLAKLFHAANIIELFELAFNVPQPRVLLKEAIILLLQVLLEAWELIHKAAFQVLLRLIDFINHSYRSHTSDFHIDQLDIRLRLHVLVFWEKLSSFYTLLTSFKDLHEPAVQRLIVKLNLVINARLQWRYLIVQLLSFNATFE